MKLRGYPPRRHAIELISPSELAEITFAATPTELRRMAEFLAFCADEMERMGTDYGHLHLSDYMPDFDDSLQFVVTRND